MAEVRYLTAIFRGDESGYEILCPELDLTAEGATAEEAHKNLGTMITGFLKEVDPAELEARLRKEIRVDHIQVALD